MAVAGAGAGARAGVENMDKGGAGAKNTVNSFGSATLKKQCIPKNKIFILIFNTIWCTFSSCDVLSIL